MDKITPMKYLRGKAAMEELLKRGYSFEDILKSAVESRISK
jgi:hypothetical protein